jgi:hypothetical protein
MNVLRHIFPRTILLRVQQNCLLEILWTANNPDSFWSVVLRPYIDGNAAPIVLSLVDAVDSLFLNWKVLFKSRLEIPVPYRRPYFVGESVLTKTAGLIQIKDYATETNVASLLSGMTDIQERLRAAKNEFFELVNRKLDYFGYATPRAEDLLLSEKTKFEKALCRRLALAGLLVQHLHSDPNFGRTKLAKLFYLADVHEGLDLQTEYYREAAGPLDQRSLYNERFGIEALARKHNLFYPEVTGKMVRYRPLASGKGTLPFARRHLGNKVENIVEF